MRGGFYWNELNTPDVARTKTFYSELFGWGTADMPMPTGMYTVWQHGGKGHGGAMQTGGPGLENIPPMWLTYIESDDIDGDHQRVIDLGGKAITHVMEVPEVGRWFLAEDPTGAQFALMQPFPQPAQAAPEPAAAAAKKKPAARKAKPKAAAQKKPARKVAAKKAAAQKKAAKAAPAKAVSAKAKPAKAALKTAKRVKGQRPGKMAKRDLASAKRRTASLKGRSQNNFRR